MTVLRRAEQWARQMVAQTVVSTVGLMAALMAVHWVGLKDDHLVALLAADWVAQMAAQWVASMAKQKAVHSVALSAGRMAVPTVHLTVVAMVDRKACLLAVEKVHR